jgi:hypothetical protein
METPAPSWLVMGQLNVGDPEIRDRLEMVTMSIVHHRYPSPESLELMTCLRAGTLPALGLIHARFSVGVITPTGSSVMVPPQIAILR